MLVGKKSSISLYNRKVSVLRGHLKNKLKLHLAYGSHGKYGGGILNKKPKTSYDVGRNTSQEFQRDK